MSSWQRKLTTLVTATAQQLDALQLRVKQRHELLKPTTILAYRGHGNAQVLYLKGRVLERSRVRTPTNADTVWRNIANMYRRFASDEIAGAQVHARLHGQTYVVITDDEGYFNVTIAPPAPLPLERVWHEIELELISPKAAAQGVTVVTGAMLVPSPRASFGVISDIDDTIVQTDVPHLLKMARTVFLNNAYTRVPFEGVAAFYHALQRGATSASANPIFYVSSSPWNLYDLLADFFAINGLPPGPLFLRDYDLDDRRFAGHAQHKLERILPLMDMYPELPFILIGDSGQEDPELYREVVRSRAAQVRAIYIRDVTGEERRASMQQIAAAVDAQRVPMLFVRDTVEAAEHAAAHGFIDPAALPAIRAKKEQDQQAKDPIDQVLDA